MKRKIVMLAFLILAVSIMLCISASAEMVVSDDYIRDDGEIFTLQVGSSEVYYLDASYLTTDGESTIGRFYYKIFWWNGNNTQLLAEVYLPNDFDLSQVIITPDCFYLPSGQFAGYHNVGTVNFEIYTFTSATEEASGITYENKTDIASLVKAISISRNTILIAESAFSSWNSIETFSYNGRTAVPKTAIFSSTLSTIGKNAFGGSGDHKTLPNIERLVFEDRGNKTLTIGQYAFSRGILKEIVFYPGVYNLNNGSNDAISHQYNESGVGQLEKIVVMEGVTISGSISWELKRTYDIVFIGNENSYNEAKSTFINALNASSGNVIYENSCYLNGHTLSDKEILSYPNGYCMAGVKYSICTTEGCGYESSKTEIPALFTCLGYSTPTDGREGLAIGFTLDKEALAEYEEATGKALNYGVFAILKDRLGDNDVFAQDGTAIEGSINADITSYEFVAFELRIEGFIDEYKDVKLAMGAYVAETDGETTKYSYLQAGTPAENEKYCFVSYNDIASSSSN